ncbi:energy transducer TonB [Croceitalea rosinachiae]|uniref:Energy transducer TonB n=1 Tax=Croceitalea rosinachiae TaxID=3075596 RepID=A0ABU3A6R3_9FLAO|nr:energy transducer TonB [Croceitalea sp. F388]MDT0605583.1 energy transducer TonB [Croceitalea sp. F388]
MKLSLLFFLLGIQFILSQESKIYTSNDVDTLPILENYSSSNPGTAEGFKDQIKEHIQQNLDYPIDALNAKLTGTAYVSLIIDSLGIVKSVRTRSKQKLFEQEAKRIFNALPKAIPAKIKGKSVSFSYNWPIVFDIGDEQLYAAYFPQEQLVHEKCENTDNPNECLYNFFEEKVRKFLSSKKVSNDLLKYENDTLIAGGNLVVDHKGLVLKEKSYMAIKGTKLNKKMRTDFRNLFFESKFKEVLFYKYPPNTSIHSFYFNYLISKSDDKITLELIQKDDTYNGGVVQEVPIFPGCEGLDNEKAKLCFQEKVQNHIKYHFKYPEKALRERISGKVSVVFVISKEGDVIKIRTKARHPILEKEALRIVKLLPKIMPGKQNGKPVKVPFSFPMWFRLN